MGKPAPGAKAPSAAAAKEAPSERDSIAELRGLLEKARAAEGKGGPQAAIALLEGAAPDVKALGTLHYAKGTLHFRAGELDRAVAEFREAVRIEPDVPEFAGNLGAALVEQATRGGKGRAALDEAIAVLEAAAVKGPKLGMVFSNYGRALQVAGRADEALEAVERALEMEPKSVSALLGHASLLNQLGRGEESLASLDAALAVDPSCAPARQAREIVRRRLGK